MTINWAALGIVAAVSLVVGVLVVVLISMALVGLSTREPDPADGPADDTLNIGPSTSGPRHSATAHGKRRGTPSSDR